MNVAAIKTRSCLGCGNTFTFPATGGRDRSICSKVCRVARNKVLLKAAARPCIVPDCKGRRQYASGVCNTCYYRLKRTGTLDRKPRKGRTITTHGYVALLGVTHPLQTKSRSVLYEHRVVLYDSIGPGPHQCHWCHATVDWVKGKCVRGSLVPDHLDGDKTNNHRSNLVPACNGCNSTRGLFMAWVRRHKDDPFLWEMYQESLRKASA